MGIFDLFKGKKECGCSCGCGDKKEVKISKIKPKNEGIPVVKILGIGCKNCEILGENTKKAFELMGKEVEIIKVTDMKDIASYGIMSTPGLVLNEKVISYGKVLKSEEIVKLVENNL